MGVGRSSKNLGTGFRPLDGAWRTS